MPASYDLHLHTCWSYDATAQAEDHLRAADALGVTCIAITDHHNIDSADEVAEAARRYPHVGVIVAAELTVSTSLGDVDLLCYNLPRRPEGPLAEVLGRYRQWQQDFGEATCRAMQAAGFDYTREQRLALLRGFRPPRVLAVQGATHVQNEAQRDWFVQRGFIQSPADYGPLMQRLRQEQVLPPYPDVAAVTAAVHEAGGVIAIAHPKGYFAGADRQRMDRLRVECALDGIECAHPSVDRDLTPVYRAYCQEHGLFSAAGSDCHSPGEIDRYFARHGGAEQWLEELLERLRDISSRRWDNEPRASASGLLADSKRTAR